MTDQDQQGLSEDEFESLTTDDKRWKGVAKQFAAVNLRLSSQDVVINGQGEKIDALATVIGKISEDTGAMRSAWNEGVATKRFFCRLAEAWKFLYKQMFIPLVVPGIFLYAAGYYAVNGTFPKFVVAVYKAFF